MSEILCGVDGYSSLSGDVLNAIDRVIMICEEAGLEFCRGGTAAYWHLVHTLEKEIKDKMLPPRTGD